MNDLDSRINALRATRVRVRKNIQDAWRIADVGDRAQAVQAREGALRSTEPEWRELQRQKDARVAAIALAMLGHQRTRPAAASRRSVPNYVTKVMVPGR